MSPDDHFYDLMATDQERWERVQKDVQQSLGTLPPPTGDSVQREHQELIRSRNAKAKELELLSQSRVSSAFFFEKFATNARELLRARAAVLWSPTSEGPVIAHTDSEIARVAELNAAARVRIIGEALQKQHLQLVTLVPPLHDATRVLQDWKQRMGESCQADMILDDDLPVDASTIVSPIVADRMVRGVLEVHIPHTHVYPPAGPSMAPALLRRAKGLSETAAEFLLNKRR